VANPDEPFREDVQRETPEELVELEHHALLTTGLQTHKTVFDVQDAAVGEPDPMGIAAQVAVDVFRSGKGGLGIDHPVLAIELLPQGEECFGSCQMSQPAAQLQLPGCEQVVEPGQELTPKQGRHDPNREKVFSPAELPKLAAECEPATGDNHVDVRMKPQVSCPGMQDQGKSWLCSESIGTGRELEERCGYGLEEEVEKELPVAQDQGAQSARKGEDTMEVRDGKKGGHTFGHPASPSTGLAVGAMAIATGVVRRAFVTTMGTDVEMASQLGSPAGHEVVEDTSDR